MHVFVYEWVTGGGMLAHPGRIPPSMLTEGLAMVQAVANDFAAAPNTRVTVLQDLRVLTMSILGGEQITVGSRAEHNEAFDRFCREADAVLVIAPETDRVLATVVERAERLGARLLSPSGPFVAVASDKHATAIRLAEAGVPTPEGVVLEPYERPPVDFPYPAVIKPLDGAGSQDIWVLTGPTESPPAYVAGRRLEPFVPGMAASVAVLTGPGGSVPLPPCKQKISADGRLGYLGGATPLAGGLAERATRLATRAIEALPPCVGYAGVDLVLGAAPDGSGDRVIEVNPRLTTSYTGLRFAVEQNLATAMLAVSRGERTTLDLNPRPLEFGADGAVSYLDSREA